MKIRILVLCIVFLLALGVVLVDHALPDSQMRLVHAEPEIFASPIHAGCYIAAPSDCRIHVEPLTINIQGGSKIMYFQLIAAPTGYSPRVIYDWKPDLGNPLPPSGTIVQPSQVTQDFAATCGRSYSISLQGRDTLDGSALSLGTTGTFTCPSVVP
jgi:hypothetical protein